MDLGVLYFADKPDAKPGQNMVKTWSKYREYGSVWLDSQETANMGWMTINHVDYVDHHKFFLIVFKDLAMVFSHSTSVKDINGYNQSIPI